MLSLEKISVAPSQRYLFPVIIQFEIFFFLLDTVESVFGMVSEGPGRSRKQKETRVLYRQVGGLGENLNRHCHHRRQHSQANPLPSLKGESILGTAALYNKTPLLLFSYWVLSIGKECAKYAPTRASKVSSEHVQCAFIRLYKGWRTRMWCIPLNRSLLKKSIQKGAMQAAAAYSFCIEVLACNVIQQS